MYEIASIQFVSEKNKYDGLIKEEEEEIRVFALTEKYIKNFHIEYKCIRS